MTTQTTQTEPITTPTTPASAVPIPSAATLADISGPITSFLARFCDVALRKELADAAGQDAAERNPMNPKPATESYVWKFLEGRNNTRPLRGRCSRPWLEGDHVYASDSKVLVRVHRSVFDRTGELLPPKFPRDVKPTPTFGPLVESVLGKGSTFAPLCLTPFETDMAAAKACTERTCRGGISRDPCDSCGGDKTCQCDCGHKHDCHGCNGTGRGDELSECVEVRMPWKDGREWEIGCGVFGKLRLLVNREPSPDFVPPPQIRRELELESDHEGLAANLLVGQRGDGDLPGAVLFTCGLVEGVFMLREAGED